MVDNHNIKQNAHGRFFSFDLTHNIVIIKVGRV